MDFDLHLDRSKISGTAERPGVKATISGKKLGGSDIPDSEIPPLISYSPLTDADRERILGVEACMWTEFVTEETLDSRLWPRTVAIAEKAWSKKSDTVDSESGLRDMYRRLDAVSQQLADMGSTHYSYREPMLKALSGQEQVDHWLTLVETLEPVKYHSGQKYLRNTDVFTVFRRIADVSAPESRLARVFRHRVDAYLQGSLDEPALQTLRNQLIAWRDNDRSLEPQLSGVADEAALRALSQLLSKLSTLALQVMDDKPLQCNSVEELFSKAKLPYAAVQLAVAPALKQLINSGCTR